MSNTGQKKHKLSVKSYITSTGTWTQTTNSGLPFASKSATAETTKISIPLNSIPSNDGQFGVQITKILIPIRLATANAVSVPTATLYKRNNVAVAAAGTNLTASTVTSTATGLNLTAVATDRLITITPSSVGWDWKSGDDLDYNVELKFNCATTTALRIYDAMVYYNTTASV